MSATCANCGKSFGAPEGDASGVCPDCRSQSQEPTDFIRPKAASGDTDETLAMPRAAAHPSTEETIDMASTPATRPDLQRDAQGALKQLGPYEITSLLGKGGMGTVYEATDTRLDRRVAVKVVRAGEAASEDDIRRFRLEARNAAKLKHPNIVPIFDVGQSGELDYFVMEYVEGETLDAWLRRRERSYQERLEMLEKVARAIQHAHEQGIVHRDIKPGNVMVDAANEPHVMDFGLARNVKADSSLTVSGTAMGTPAYMPPEQAQGKVSEIDARSDVWSLGAVLYEALTGRPPFTGENVLMVLQAVTYDDPTFPRQIDRRIPRDVETICLKCLEKDRSRRYSSAAQLADDCRRFLQGEPIAARPASVIYKVRKKLARHRAVAVVTAVAAAALLALAVWALHQRKAALRQGKIAEFEAGLDASDWDEDRLAEMEAVVGELDTEAATWWGQRRGPDFATEARRRLYDRFAQAILLSIRNPRLEAGDVSRIERLLAVLEGRAPGLMPPLREALRKRLGMWEPVLAVAPPFDDVGAVLEVSSIRVEGDVLVAAREPNAVAAPNVLTRVRCAGSAQLDARFRDWEDADGLGLALNVRGGMRYAFLLRAGGVDDPLRRGAGRPTPTSVAAGRRLGSAVRIEILRGDAILRQREIAASDLPTGPLSLSARREGGRLTFTVGALPELVFEDTFPLSEAEPGVFGLCLPPGVGLESLRGSLKSMPPEPSPLEKGDALYAGGRLQEALLEYRRQAAGSTGTKAGQEARYKEGLCLESLKRHSEAEKVFEGLAGEEGDRWPALAACRLWALCLGEGRFDEADALFVNLATRYKLEDLFVLVPDEVRWRIVGAFDSEGSGLGLLLPNPDRRRNLERALKVAEFMDAPIWLRLNTKWALARTHHLSGDYDGALARVEEFMKGTESEHRGQWGISEAEWHVERSWLLRLKGEPERALELVDGRLFEKSGKLRTDVPALLTERARVHASLKKWEKAEEDVELFFRTAGARRIKYRFYADACLLRGFLRERRGDVEGALEAWRKGRYRHGAEEYRHPDTEEARDAAGGMSGLGRLTNLLLTSLTGGVARKELEGLAGDLIGRVSSSGGFGGIETVGLPAGVYEAAERAQRAPRWREYARGVALREIPFGDFFRLPVMIVIVEFVKLGALPAEEQPQEVDELLWRVAGEGYAAYVSGHFNAVQLAQLALAWKGSMNFLGWGGVKGTLEPGLRGPAAYVLGHRLIRSGKRKEAADLFRDALADAEPGSALERLSAGALEGLDAAGGR